MIVTELKPGTKLMWEAPGPGWEVPLSLSKDKILYTAIVSPGYPRNKLLEKCVRITTGHKTHWVGPEEEHLRQPTADELKQYSWPKEMPDKL